MTAHELANQLLQMPNVDVYITRRDVVFTPADIKLITDVKAVTNGIRSDADMIVLYGSRS